jgi:prefoldin subunit 5
MSELQQDLDEVHAQAARFEREVDLLGIQIDRLDGDRPSPEQVALAVSEAKRVRRESNLLVRTLARLRDNLQP